MIAIAVSTTEKDGGEYAHAIRAAGALPRLLPFDIDAIDAALGRCGGVLLSGGADVDPQQYGAANAGSEDIYPERDVFEIALVRRARERGIPTLCICRGLQLANVAFGGTLHQEIGSILDARSAQLHRFKNADGKSERGLLSDHAIAIERNSLLATVVGQPLLVTGSRHHQSLDRVAADLRVVAATSDGIVEAAEARFASPFWLGVQWHPESTLDACGPSRAIFAEFVAAAGRFRAV